MIRKKLQLFIFRFFSSKKTTTRGRRGSTLVEIMIATGIIALVMTAIVSVIAVSIRSTAQAKGKALATKYSQEGMEFFRQQRAVLGWSGFSAILQAKGNPSTLCLATIPNAAQFRSLGNGACGANSYVDTRQQFQRNALISLSSSGTSQVINVTVRTTWYEGNQLRTNDVIQAFRFYQLTDATSPSQAPVPSPPIPPYVATFQAASNTADATANGGDRAVDGDTTTFWNSGNFPSPTQWIRINLGQPRTVSKIRLVANHYPAGNSTDKIYVSSSSSYAGGYGTLVHTFSQYVNMGDSLTKTFSPALTNVQYVTVETTASNSWVAWYEVEAYP